jgi:hypothetical protein
VKPVNRGITVYYREEIRSLNAEVCWVFRAQSCRSDFINFVTAYIRAAAALCIITLLTDVVATLFTGLGLRSKDHRTKYKYYRVAVYIMVLSRMLSIMSTC